MQYEADALPASSSPAWTAHVGGGSQEISPAGTLHLSSPNDSSYVFYEINDIYSQVVSNTFEVKVQIVSAGGVEPFVVTSTLWSNTFLQFHADKVRIIDSSTADYFMDTTDSQHVYTVVNDQINYKTHFYVDGDYKLTVDAYEGDWGSNTITFGINTGATDVKLDYLYAGCCDEYLTISPSVSLSPSLSPSVSPSRSPSVSPSVSVSPSRSPSISPSMSPSTSPSASPSAAPTQETNTIFFGTNF